MRVLRWCIVAVSIGPGVFMTFDGSRALILGDYLTPRTGPHAGQLGPWSEVVMAVGVPPRSTTMKLIFVVLGVAWLAALTAFARRMRSSAGMLAAVSILTLWYLPVGTVSAALVLVSLARLRWWPAPRN